MERASCAGLGRVLGKSGGLRIITFFGGVALPVFLMTLFAKNEQANLSKAERNELAVILTEVRRTYRKARKHRYE